MNAFHRGRAAVCGGAIVLALGAGMVVVPAAGATTIGTGLLGGSTSGGAGGALGSTTSAVTTTAVAPVTGTTSAATPAVGAVAGSVVSTASTTTSGATDPLVSTQTGGGSTTIGLVNGGNGSLATVTLGTAGGSGTGTGSGSGAAAGGTAVDAVSGVVSGLLGGQGESTAGAGGGTAGGTGAAHVDVQLGGTMQGEVTTPVTLPSTPATPVMVDALPTPDATPAVSAPVVSTPATSTPAVTAPTTEPVATLAPAIPVPTPTPAASTPSTAAAPGTASATSAGRTRLLSLRAAPSIATVFPVKDGYLDDVVFHLAAATSTGKAVAVEGQAVLKRGSREVARWTIGRSTQDLRWNGLDHGKVVGGVHTLIASLTDATGGTHTATTRVTASAKKLVAATTRLSTFAVSGTHAMAAAPRAGLAKGTVTVRITTVAAKVVGKQSLIFEKAGRRIVVPIKAGTHTSRLITVPKSFTSFTIRHTWKKGQVALKSVQTTYSYQTLR